MDVGSPGGTLLEAVKHGRKGMAAALIWSLFATFVHVPKSEVMALFNDKPITVQVRRIYIEVIGGGGGGGEAQKPPL